MNSVDFELQNGLGTLHVMRATSIEFMQTTTIPECVLCLVLLFPLNILDLIRVFNYSIFPAALA